MPGAQSYGLQKKFNMAEKVKSGKKPGVKSFLGGTILTEAPVLRQLRFLFFLAFLALVQISNRNWSERTIRQIGVVQDSLAEMRSESIVLSAKLMDASRPSEVLKKVESAGIGLEQPLRPPQKIVVKKE